MTWASAGPSSACSMQACTTARSRAGPGRAPPRSPGSLRGSATARAAIAACSTGSPSAPRPGPSRTPPPAERMRERLRLAVPNKGRLVEPTLALLHDAGLVFEEHDRSLVARVQNLDLDILFVRTNDIIEFVGDGVADLGITGSRSARRDRSRAARRAGAGLRPMPPCCRGPVRLADPGDRRPRRCPGRDRPSEHDPPVLRRAADPGRGHLDLRGGRGRPAARASPRRSSTSSRPAPRSDERAAPGRRRPASQAILIANPAAQTERADELGAVETMLSAVLAARGRKYLLMNAPATRLEELRGCCPGSNRRRSSRSPTRG